MDDRRFDTWVRGLRMRLLSRRRAIRLLPAGLGLLAGLVRLDVVAASCPKGKKRCGKRCIPRRECCSRADCGPRGNGKV
jgi:hypothetical protein